MLKFDMQNRAYFYMRCSQTRFSFVNLLRRGQLISKVLKRVALFPLLISMFSYAQLYAECSPPPYPKEAFTHTAQKLGGFDFWEAFKDTDPTLCWTVASPYKTETLANPGKTKLCRSQPNISITFKPSTGTYGQLSYLSGFHLSTLGEVEIKIDGNLFELPSVKTQYAWPLDRHEDERIFEVLKAAKAMEITSRAESGHKIRDYFSLTGLETALNEAEMACQTIFVGM